MHFLHNWSLATDNVSVTTDELGFGPGNARSGTVVVPKQEALCIVGKCVYTASISRSAEIPIIIASFKANNSRVVTWEVMPKRAACAVFSSNRTCDTGTNTGHDTRIYSRGNTRSEDSWPPNVELGAAWHV